MHSTKPEPLNCFKRSVRHCVPFNISCSSSSATLRARKMPQNFLDPATMRMAPLTENIAAVDSMKHRLSHEYPIAEKHRYPKKNEKSRESGNYKIGPFEFQSALIWPNLIGIVVLHIGAVYALFTFSFVNHKMLTLWGKSDHLDSGKFFFNLFYLIFYYFRFSLFCS